jgi:hypothetical protein
MRNQQQPQSTISSVFPTTERAPRAVEHHVRPGAGTRRSAGTTATGAYPPEPPC